MRDEILRVLREAGHGMTPDSLIRRMKLDEALKSSPVETIAGLGRELYAMQDDRLVWLHRDSSAGNRMGGWPLPDGSRVTLVSLRVAE